MKLGVLACVAFINVFFSAFAYAQIKTEEAENVLQKSGVLRQIDAMVPAFRTEFVKALQAHGGGSIKAEDIEQYAALASQSFDAEKLKRSIIASTAQSITPQNVAPLIRWYSGAAGKRIEAIEFEVSKRDSSETLKQGAALLPTVPSKRLAVYKEIVELTRAVEFLTDLALNTGIAVGYGAAQASSDLVVPFDAFRAEAKKQRSALLVAMNDVALAAFAATYQQATERDLDAYLNFLRTAAGKEFSAATLTAFERAFIQSAAALGKALVESRKSSRS
jgi:hypothetical protein